MAEIKLLPRADRDLHHALLDHDRHARETGDRFIERVAGTLEQLEDWPESGRLLPALSLRKLRIRHTNFAFLYDYRDGVVRIARVVDLRSDPKSWEL